MARVRSRSTGLAKLQRRSGNVAESKLWHALQNRNLNGQKFRRQLPIGAYIADFASVELMLVIELDGSQHIDNHDDQIRNQYLNDAGWSVARFSSGDVLSDPDSLLETIAAICDGRISQFVNARDFQFYPRTTEASNMTPKSFMRRAIALARPGKTWPNPSVGCVLIRDDRIVAEGTTGDGGRPHAEEVALDAAGVLAQGAVAYITLEPCGLRSMPCASCSERLIAAGVAKVVYACDDPSPLASHLGPQRLKDAGIPVEGGMLADEAAHLIAPFAYFLKTGRPMVRIATGPDGFDAEFIADPRADLDAELSAMATKGYRSLYVTADAQTVPGLRTLGLLTE